MNITTISDPYHQLREPLIFQSAPNPSSEPALNGPTIDPVQSQGEVTEITKIGVSRGSDRAERAEYWVEGQSTRNWELTAES